MAERPFSTLCPGNAMGSTVLIDLAAERFGCGSSREHAPWALLQYGFKALIASSYADIFYNNRIKNGLLPVALPDPAIERLFAAVADTPGYTLTVDLVERQVRFGEDVISAFEIGDYQRTTLLEGLDEIGRTLMHADEIRAFEARHLAKHPWLLKIFGP
ncbi:3-isopropylmalate dehydratase small subunit [Castellaniella sp. WN]